MLARRASRPLSLALALAACLLPACGGMRSFHAERSLSGSASVDGARVLAASFRHGDLSAHGSARHDLGLEVDVRVQATTQAIADDVAADLEIVTRHDDGRVHVDVLAPDTTWPEDTYSIHVTSRMDVPQALGLEVSTTHGDLDLRGLHGDVHARATHGDADVHSMRGTLDVSTTHGALRLTDIAAAGRHRFESTHGDVDAHGLHGDFSLETTHGDVFARLGRLAGDHEIQTTHGRVTLEIDPDSSVEARIETSHGDISVDLPGTHLDVDSDRLTVGYGGGEGRLRISTSHADVAIRADETAASAAASPAERM